MSMPTLFDQGEAQELWAQAVESWRGQYSIGDAEQALRVEFRRRNGRMHPADVDIEVLRKFVTEVREGVIA